MILVTGGAGFIGSSLVLALVRRGGKVRVLDNLASGFLANLDPVKASIDFQEGDVRDLDAVRRAARGVTTVFHLAAQPSVPRSIEDPLGSQEVNAKGTLHVLVAGKEAGARRFVYAASSSAYGESPALPKRESMAPAPKSPYAVDKLTGEYLCQVYHAAHGLGAVSLRFFNVFGPRQRPDSPYAAVVPRFIARMQEGKPPLVYGDGEQSRDFTYVDNVVDACLRAAEAPGAPGRVLNVGIGERITINELIRRLSALFGREPRADHEPERPGDVRHSLADISLAREILGYSPAVGLEEGLRRTVDWFQAQGRERS